MQKWIILILIIIIAIIGIFIVFNVDVETEYVPEAEFQENDMRNTIISLYFFDKISNSITKENRMVDSKELLKNPYKVLVEILAKGPENINNEGIIPENTKIIDVSFENGVVVINFDKNFSENVEKGDVQKSKVAIFQTLTELTEVEDVKILVEGVEIAM